ncbi:MAG: RidA family protein [Chloroflexi bacterium]|nr:RidA family protein [Chloroflexota bacterium]
MADKQIIIPEGGAKPLAPYSDGVRFGHLVFTAGQIGLDPKSGKLVEGGVSAEAEQAMKNLGAVLDAGGASFGSIVKVTIFLADIADYGAVNEVYAKYFDEAPPARSAVQVVALPAGARVEIEAVAALA